MLYLQNGDRIVAIDYMTSLHPIIGNENVPPTSWRSDGSLGWPFPALNINTFFQIKYTETVLSNSTRKLLWFEIN